MDTKEYQTIIEKTAVFPTIVDNFGLAYCWLGVLGETAEAALCHDPNNIKKEIGDVMWYSAAICKQAGAQFENVIDKLKEMLVDDSALDFTIMDVISFSEKIKKYYRDNALLDLDRLENLLANNLCIIMNYQGIPAMYIEEILEMNYNKLMKRRETNTLHGSGDNREEV